ncbi:probable aspartic protease At2g35615 isoform X2 [Nicotiana tomentosiformis]|uniref:probable aspartic protease At2g35615 isoform X1 n=1 Tax=Nicotiana tomentosiformis TaxID=4098 RepID=UPI00051BFFAE|nr:probable aspartic protease At2g35615 isoform X1 [Nicotiana tomentosiformis]XP_018631879.1 probable aspartic protease At2g35615 isoform X2 [Nicotiana tomentosiformis]
MNHKNSFTLLFFLAILAFSHLALVSCRKTKSNDDVKGFTLDLIHRDSPFSPLYNPSITPSRRLREAYHRSFSRATFFKAGTASERERPFIHQKEFQSDVIPIPGEYLMKFSIGTPPVETVAIADTGSDLTWIQCKPCADCFKQTAPLFDSRKSSTYKTVKCDTKACEIVGSTSCVRKNVCEYEMSYGDQSHSVGDVAFETFTFDTLNLPSKSDKRKISFPDVVFGCGHDNGGTFTNLTTGIVGLGGSNLSIVKQLEKEVVGSFSYCLIPLDLSSSSASNATSHISFGPLARVSGPKVVTTPIILKEPRTYYYINLESVSVGKKKLAFKSSRLSSFAADGELGNMIIDSGTTLTLLPSDFYENLESTLVDTIKGKRKEDPTGTFALCYESKNGVINAPEIVFHFTNADVGLLPTSTFAEIDEGLACLTIVPADEIAIFGNLAQVNYLIGYDLIHERLSFLPTDCTKH